MPLGIGKLLNRLAPGKVHEEELQPGSTVKNYTVLKRLGAGQYAVVSALQAPLLADPRSCGGASLRGGKRCCQVAQIGLRAHWDVSSGQQSQGHFSGAAAARRRLPPAWQLPASVFDLQSTISCPPSACAGLHGAGARWPRVCAQAGAVWRDVAGRQARLVTACRERCTALGAQVHGRNSLF